MAGRPIAALLRPLPPRWRGPVQGVAAVAVAAAALLYLHATGLAPLAWQTVPLAPEAFRPGGGHLFTAELPARWMADADTPQPNPAVVREDGRPLPLPRSLKAAIRGGGGGRYTLEPGRVRLSSTDGSDPRAGRHAYVLRWPRPVPGGARALLYAAGLAGLAALAWLQRERLGRLGRGRRALWTGLGILAAVWAATRLPFFLLHPFPGVLQDTFDYLRPVMEAEAGRWPMFGFRTPGYSLLLMGVGLLTDRVLPLLVAQSLLSLGAFCLLLHAVHRSLPRLTLPAALLLAGVMAVPDYLDQETSVLSDSAYASGILAASACLLAGLRLRSAGWLGAASALMAAAILVRPAGLFYAVIYVLVLAFLAWNRAPGRVLAAFALPFAALLTLAAAYNAATRGAFTVTTMAGDYLANATALFWEPDPAFAPETNAMIAAVTASFPEADRRLVRTSWDLKALARTFRLDYADYVHITPFVPAPLGDPVWDRRLRRISLHAIRKHPDAYARFVLSMGRLYFFDNLGTTFSIHNALVRRYYDMLGGTFQAKGYPEAEVRRAYAEFYRAPARGYALVPVGGATALRLEFTPASKPQQLLIGWSQGLLQHAFWGWLPWAALAVAATVLARRRGRDAAAFAVVVLGLTWLGSGLLTSMTVEASVRYSYPVLFLVFLTPLLAAGLFLRDGAGERGGG